MKKITSKDNEKIKYVAKLILNKKFRETEKKFVVEGFKAVYEACCFGLKLREVFVHHSFLEKFEFLDENKFQQPSLFQSVLLFLTCWIIV